MAHPAHPLSFTGKSRLSRKPPHRALVGSSGARWVVMQKMSPRQTVTVRLGNAMECLWPAVVDLHCTRMSNGMNNHWNMRSANQCGTVFGEFWMTRLCISHSNDRLPLPTETLEAPWGP
jgi:hypothetical protein